MITNYLPFHLPPPFHFTASSRTCIPARSKEWQSITPSLPVFLARFPISCVPSLLSLFLRSLVIWRVLVIGIPANGCLASSPSFVRVSLYIYNVCSSFCCITPTPSISPNMPYLGLCISVLLQEALHSSHGRAFSPRRLLFNLYSRPLFCSHPRSSLTVTASYRLVSCSCGTSYVEQCLFACWPHQLSAYLAVSSDTK